MEKRKTLHEIYLEKSAEEADTLVQFPCEEESREPVYYLKCTHFWTEFKSNPSFSYPEQHQCAWMEKLGVSTQEEADRAAEEAVRTKKVCPLCGTAGKYKGASQFEIYNDRRLLESINRSEIHHG